MITNVLYIFVFMLFNRKSIFLGSCILLLWGCVQGCHDVEETIVLHGIETCPKLKNMTSWHWWWWPYVKFQSTDGRPLHVSHEPCGCENAWYINDRNVENGSVPSNGSMMYVNATQVSTGRTEPYSISLWNCGDFISYGFWYHWFTDVQFCLTDLQDSCKRYETDESAIGYSNDTSMGLCPEVQSFQDLSKNGLFMEAIFRCLIPKSNNNSLYDIRWFINDIEITDASFNNISYTDLNSTALRPEHWVNNYTLNFKATCGVRAKHIPTGKTSSFYKSKTFFAGVKTGYAQYTVVEGTSKLISFQSTVPFGCPVAFAETMSEFCKSEFYVWTPTGSKCRNGIMNNNVAFKKSACGITFNYKSWDKPVYLEVTGYTDGIINYNDRTTTIKLGTTKNPNDPLGIWNDVVVPDIQVTVIDKDRLTAWKLCISNTDPHMRTFDGRYWPNQRTGEFVLYQHKTLPYTIHVLYSTCVPGRATCNCGIAIRNGGSIYVVTTCVDISTSYTSMHHVPQEKLKLCDEKDIVVDKRYRYYKVTLPSGTEVSFSISIWSNWVGSIRIRASVPDIDNTEGLCGYVNGNDTDDFIPKGGTSPTDYNRFADSWRIQPYSEDSLFVNNPRILTDYSWWYSVNSPSQSGTQYCTCTHDGPINTYTFNFEDNNFAHCNLTSPSQPCGDSISMTTRTCSAGSSRKKRDTTDDDDVVGYQTPTYAPGYDSSIVFQSSDWINGWNETSARSYCVNVFETDPAVSACIQMVNVTCDSYIDDCIEDIKMSGNTSWTDDTLETLKGTCLTEATRNEVFYVNESSSADGFTVIQMLTSLLCPSNCSGNGQCVNATCMCNDGYIGDDCSTTTANPPSNIMLPENGLCDSSSRPCKRINVLGHFNTENITAKLINFPISNNQYISNATSYFVKAEFRNYNLITVNIPDTQHFVRRRRSTEVAANGWNVSLSYDGLQFSNHVTLLVFNKKQFTCNMVTLTCNPTQSVLSGNQSDSQESQPLIIAIVFVGVTILIAAVIVGLVMIKKCKEPMRTVSSPNVRDDCSATGDRHEFPFTALKSDCDVAIFNVENNIDTLKSSKPRMNPWQKI